MHERAFTYLNSRDNPVEKNLCLFLLQYELKLTASDNLKENYTIVVIHVKDVNDNPPVFERPTYQTQITEEDDRNLPKRVLQVRGYWLQAHNLSGNLLNLSITYLHKPKDKRGVRYGHLSYEV